MTFKPHEIEFMRGADLGRLATMQPDGTLQNSPVGFTYNDELGTIDIAGYRMSHSQKFRNVAVNPTVAFVVDDIASTGSVAGALPGDPRHGGAGRSRSVATGTAGDELDAAIIRITPHRIIGFGIDDTDTEPHLLEMDSRAV